MANSTYQNLFGEVLVSVMNNVVRSLEEPHIPEPNLQMVIDKWWPDLEHRIKSIPKPPALSSPTRSDRELLEEVLATTRRLDRYRDQTFIPGRVPARLSDYLHQRIDVLDRRLGGLEIEQAQLARADPDYAERTDLINQRLEVLRYEREMLASYLRVA